MENQTEKNMENYMEPGSLGWILTGKLPGFKPDRGRRNCVTGA